VAGQTGEIALLLARAERLVARRLAAVLENERLTVPGWRVLTLLADGKGHPMTEVADHSMLPPGSLTKLVDQLAEDNLVYRRIDPADRRRIRAFLTRRGRDTHARVTIGLDRDLARVCPADLADRLAALIAELESARPATPALPRR
jgi:DNA-binding MarR family transcriptional regulator